MGGGFHARPRVRVIADFSLMEDFRQIPAPARLKREGPTEEWNTEPLRAGVATIQTDERF